jgi:ribonucleoside-diphosphate reductase alpha subunit
MNNKDELDTIINNDYNYLIDYFGFKTLEYSYLIKDQNTKETIELPQMLWLRVAVAIHMPRNNEQLSDNCFENIKNTYKLIAEGKFIHATPTLFNAGTNHEQLSSCFLLGSEDNIEGIFKTFTDCGQISKWAGGIGVHISNIRSKGQLIKKTNGESGGIVPLMKVLNEVGRYVNQSGKRKGSIAVYIEPWHADIFEFLDLRKNGGNEAEKCRDLFLALWIPDLFMKCVETNAKWYLMSEDDCPGLSDKYGDDFETLYNNYVEQGKYVAEVDAEKIWKKIIASQMETGTPYILYKDSVNKKSNQKNIGTIKSSNLCVEICEYSNNEEYSVCNLASIAVNKFYNKETCDYDYEELHKVAQQVTYNLNRIIDFNFYPLPETKKSNLLNRPIGVGIQGFADLLAIMRLPYESSEAINLSGLIMETIYHGCLTMSNKLAKSYGTYARYEGSPLSQGIFQFDMWNITPQSNRYDWSSLRESILKYGVYNSLTTALMPTASTSQILGNNECFEPFTSNIYSRLTLAGNFIILNKHLQKDLEELNLWSPEIKNKLMSSYGSVQNIEEIPQHIKNIYKTVWEIKQKSVIDHAIARAPYVDQSQSMNLFFAEPDYIRQTSALMYAWKKGLKTGMYYLRSQSSSNAQQFTIDPVNKTEECTVCSA